MVDWVDQRLLRVEAEMCFYDFVDYGRLSTSEFHADREAGKCYCDLVDQGGLSRSEYTEGGKTMYKAMYNIRSLWERRE